MKKLILITVFCVSMAIGPSVQAQVEPINTVQAEELKATLIKLLTEMIAQLQAQINELLAKQTITEQKVVVLTKTEPVLGVQAEPTKISFGTEGFKDLDKSYSTVVSNKELDLSKTELWINGQKVNISTELVKKSGDTTNFYFKPSLYSFMVGNVYDSIQVKFITSDGEVVSSEPSRFTWSTSWAIPEIRYFKSEL